MSLTTNLIAYYKLEETSGTRADSSINGYNLTASGTDTGNTTGKLGNGCYFNNTGFNLFNTSSAFNFSATSFTIAFWVKLNQFSNATIIRCRAATAYRITYVYDDPTYSINAFVYDGASGETTATVSGISVNAFHFIAVTFDSATKVLTLRVNTSTANGNSTANSPSSDDGIILSQLALDMVLDSVGIWNRKLSSTELDTLRNSGSGLEIESWPSDAASVNASALPQALQILLAT